MMLDISFPLAVAVFAAAALVVAIAGSVLTRLADSLADRTGLGEAMAGAVLLGAATSLAGVVAATTASLDGRASLAFSTAVGGIAAQTAFLAVADLVWRRANLEHAAADLANLFQCALLALMLGLPIVAFAAPPSTLFGLHPVSILLLTIYLLGLRATAGVRTRPMWTPVATPETREDLPEAHERSGGALLAQATLFLALAALLAIAGWTIARSGARIADATAVSDTAVGALLNAISTSLPELVTTVAAARRGALQLAVGGVIGGNVFDMLFLTVADAAWREGSLYHAIDAADLLWLAIGLSMTMVLLLGLIARQRRGPGGIGVESVILLAIYLGAVVVQSFIG